MNNYRCLNQVRRISQAAFDKLNIISSQGLLWKANEDDPRKHTSLHEGLFYKLPSDNQIVKIFGHPSAYDIETTKFYNTIGMTPLMIRKPALKGMDYLRKINYEVPNVRILFYGDKGHGKTHTLTHLLHYLYLNQEHIIIHIREMKKFTRSPVEHTESATRPGRIDTPLNAATLLQQFRIQNQQLLEKLEQTLVSSKEYRWSSREVTKAGEPLASIAEHGVNRINHASDCVAVLFKELMLAADEGKIKLASILDNVKFLFSEEAGVLKHTDFKKVFVDEITVARAIKKLIKGNHKGSIVLATCDDKLSRKQNQTPREVLGYEGWNHFDPFLPIQVPKYSRSEFESCMNLYQDIGWLCRPESHSVEVRDEVRFLSGMNPGQVNYLCLSL